MLASRIQAVKESQISQLQTIEESAGLEGEQIVANQCRKALKKLGIRFKVLQSIRVPREGERGKYEIDLVIITAYGLIVIEVKHWGGVLTARDQNWLQERLDSSKTLKNPLPHLLKKKNSLIQWLKTKNAVSVSAQDIHHLVVLSNPRVRYCNNIRQAPDICTPEQLESKLKLLLGPIRSKFWQPKPSPKLPFKAVVEFLYTLPTWDLIRLNGGRVVWGDITDMQISSSATNKVQRKYIKSLKIKAYRNYLDILFPPKAKIFFRHDRAAKYAISCDDYVIIKLAGQSQSEKIPLLHLTSIELGWEDLSYYH